MDGHKWIDERMLYVHITENHRQEIPAVILAATQGEADPDRRVLKILVRVAATWQSRTITSNNPWYLQ